ncbi:sensor domain-containing diguanylate cyclase [Virgibacillus sp. C22-A2]|uniref:Sensor domain-containing diguanylate cyclase n=1 Tax=Virgibacillus tibetensis TaxID=3042313 RepID=A0ABU6K9N8_9BACI|nr:sensor domain-containing diguanylate cyclase [Virgibacillus sp. C22-A2]
MENINQLQGKLRSVYFELISEFYNHPNEQIFTIIIEQLKQITNARYIGLYIYDHWSKTYQLGSHLIDEEKFLNEEIDAEGGTVTEEKIYKISPDRVQTCILTLKPKKGPKALLYLAFDNQYNKELLQVSKSETEILLTMIHQYQSKSESDLNYKFLYELSSRLLSNTDKTDIIREIIAELQGLYPNLSFNLLLSQDSEVDPTLPVQTIEYSDDVTKRVSTQAFLSGEVQIENRLNGKSTYLYAPLIGTQGVYGVIQLVTKYAVDLTEQEIEFITEFAQTAGKAIENATLYENSIHLVSDLKLINDTTHKLNSNLKLSEITKLVRNKIIASCQATQVGFIYYNEEKNPKFDILTGSTAFFYTEKGDAFAAYLSVTEMGKEESVFNGNYSWKDNFDYRSLMVIPMSNSGTNHGLIVIMHEEPYYFSFEKFKLMQALVQHSTLAVTNTILKDKLEKAVITDYLTKLYSRNHLEDKIVTHMQKGEMGSLILFDIDDFKLVNDQYGHHIGDKVLIQVAKIIMTFLDSEDTPARWGGEELAIYAPEITINEGVQIAGLIRRQVEKFTEPMVTLSCGVSSWTKSVDDSVDELFIRADRALYEAKTTGKNSVVKNVKIK